MAAITARSTKDGTRYRAQIRLKGHPIQTATFKRKTDAKKWVGDTESAIREGRYFKTSEARKHTLGQLIDRYIQEELPKKPKSYDKQLKQLEWWKDSIGDYTLADVTAPLITEHKNRLHLGKTYRGGQRSAATVNRYLSALSHALTVAANDWEWLEDSPMRKVRKLKEPRGRVRFLSDDERASLLEACKESTEPYLYPVVVLAISTGPRKSELLNLKWKDVSLQRKTITFEETKNNERRSVHLAGHALELVQQMASVRRIDTDYLFPTSNGSKPIDVRYAFEKAVEEAELSDFLFHDLRHSAASYLAMNGASLAEIAEILGHKTLQMVKRYAHLTETHTAGVVASMNEKIFNA
jgi:integrase